MCIASDTIFLMLASLFVFGLAMAARYQWRDDLHRELNKRVRQWGAFAASAIAMLTAIVGVPSG